MGKLFQSARRMVNEAFGTNFGRVRNVEKAWEMAQEENRTWEREEKIKRRRKAERKVGEWVAVRTAKGENLAEPSPEMQPGSPEYFDKMFDTVGQLTSGTPSEQQLEGLVKDYKLESLMGMEVRFSPGFPADDFVATRGGEQVVGVARAYEGGPTTALNRHMDEFALDRSTGILKEVSCFEPGDGGPVRHYVSWSHPDGHCTTIDLNRDGSFIEGSRVDKPASSEGVVNYQRSVQTMARVIEAKLAARKQGEFEEQLRQGR